MTQYIEISNKIYELMEELADMDEQTVASMVDEVLLNWLNENHPDIVEAYGESDDSGSEDEPE